MSRQYYVYIMASASKNLYVGVTNNLERRVHEHHNKLVPAFTSRYNVTRLVHVERAETPMDAIQREKQLKRLASVAKGGVDRGIEPAVGRPEQGMIGRATDDGARSMSSFASLRMTLPCRAAITTTGGA